MKAKIIDYLENELSPQEKIAFEQALKTDTDLQKAYIFQKEQWEKLSLLRFNAKAAAILDSYGMTSGMTSETTTQEAVIKPMPYAFMTVRRVRFAALAAAALLFLFNYNSLLNWMKPTVPATQNPDIVGTKPIETTPSVAPATPVSPTPAVTPEVPVAPNPVATVKVPTQPKPKPSPVVKPKRATPEIRMEMAEIIKDNPLKVGSGKSDDSIFLATQPKKDTITSKTVIDGSTITLDNMYDFKGANGLIFKHLSKIDCKNYTVSFVIKADGTVENPQFEKGDKTCEALLLNQIKTMPILKKPIYNEKSVDYRYFFTKD